MLGIRVRIFRVFQLGLGLRVGLWVGLNLDRAAVITLHPDQHEELGWELGVGSPGVGVGPYG